MASHPDSRADRRASRGLHRSKVNRLERLRWAYVVAAAWGLSAVLIAFKIQDGRTTAAVLAAMMVISVVLHVIAFRRILARPVLWSTIVALLTTFLVGLATLGLFLEGGLFLGALGISYLTVWPAWVLGLAFGIAITFEIFVALSWAWVALTWWIVLEARRLERIEDGPREVPMTTFPAPVDQA